jgi:hypothetical protein
MTTKTTEHDLDRFRGVSLLDAGVIRAGQDVIATIDHWLRLIEGFRSKSIDLTTDGHLALSLIVLTPDEAASILRVSASTLAKWRMKSYGPTWRHLGGQIGYRLSDLLTYLDRAAGGSSG